MAIRRVTGKENTNFWLDRYGQKAGEAPMVSRVRGFGSFDNQGSYGYPITDSSDHSTNNILVHSIRAQNTQDTSDNAVIELFDNHTSTTTMTSASKKLRILVNAQLRKNSTVTIHFPIPLLLVNGGRVYRADGDVSGPLVSVCYTVLHSKGEIDGDKDIFLQSHCQTTNSAEATIVDDADVEVYGAFLNTTADNEGDGNAYSQCNIRNAAASRRAVVYINETYTVEDGDYELGGTEGPFWFPYPVYCKDGLKLENTGNSDGEDELYSTVFYRKLKKKGIDHGWT